MGNVDVAPPLAESEESLRLSSSCSNDTRRGCVLQSHAADGACGTFQLLPLRGNVAGKGLSAWAAAFLLSRGAGLGICLSSFSRSGKFQEKDHFQWR